MKKQQKDERKRSAEQKNPVMFTLQERPRPKNQQTIISILNHSLNVSHLQI